MTTLGIILVVFGLFLILENSKWQKKGVVQNAWPSVFRINFIIYYRNELNLIKNKGDKEMAKFVWAMVRIGVAIAILNYVASNLNCIIASMGA